LLILLIWPFRYFHRIRRMSTNKIKTGSEKVSFFTSSYTDPILQAIQRSHF
jgi:hypothetical protein